MLVTVNTNNGVERQNFTFKYNYLAGRRGASLSAMLAILVEEFLPLKASSGNTFCQKNFML